MSSHHIFSSFLHHVYYVVLFFSCAGDAHVAALSQVFTHRNKTSAIKKLDLRYVNVIIISANNGRLSYVINHIGCVNILTLVSFIMKDIIFNK